jgi:hypothetical protein
MSITLTREEAEAVLDALEELNKRSIGGNAICLPAEIDDAMEILRARLSAPEPQPVAWRTFDGEGGYDYRDYELNEDYGYWWEERHPNHKNWVDPLYTAPPQREWQRLTYEEVNAIHYFMDKKWSTTQLVRHVEAKLKEKNT